MKDEVLTVHLLYISLICKLNPITVGLLVSDELVVFTFICFHLHVIL